LLLAQIAGPGKNGTQSALSFKYERCESPR
jgi:hypothetical protein